MLGSRRWPSLLLVMLAGILAPLVGGFIARQAIASQVQGNDRLLLAFECLGAFTALLLGLLLLVLRRARSSKGELQALNVSLEQRVWERSHRLQAVLDSATGVAVIATDR